jgi:uncharacterized protein YuzE
MRVRYDPEVDILYVRLNEAAIVDSESVWPNLVLDRDAEQRVVGIEIMGVSQLAGAQPHKLTFEVRGRGATETEAAE